MKVLNLKKIRLQKNMSQNKLSQKSGIARGYINEIESGKYSNPSLKVVCNLCKALDITPNELIDSSLWSN